MKEYKSKTNIDLDTIRLDKVTNTDLEAHIIACLFQDNGVTNFRICSSIINEECFTHPDYAIIWSEFAKLVDDGKEVDIITFPRYIDSIHPDKSLGNRILSLMAEDSIYDWDIEKYASKLHELKLRRDLIKKSYKLINDTQNQSYDVIELANKHRDELNDIITNSKSDGVYDMKQITDMVVEMVNNNAKGIYQAGFPIGFKEIDKRGGFFLGCLNIIGAESSQGKTSLALTIAQNVSEQGTPVMIYSMEMTEKAIGTRLVSMESNLTSATIRSKKLELDELKSFRNGVCRVSHRPMYIDSRAKYSLDGILASIRGNASKYGIKLFIVDYLQVMNIYETNMTPEMALASIARKLQAIAKELNVVILALSQFNKTNDSHPLGRLRGSGQVGEAADMVMNIYRPESFKNKEKFPEPFEKKTTKGTAMIDVVKWRDNETFSFLCRYDASITRFVDDENIPDADIWEASTTNDNFLQDF